MVIGRRPQNAVSKLAYLVLFSVRSCRSSSCLGRLSTVWLVLDYAFCPLLSQMLVFLSLSVMLSILLWILVCVATSLFCVCLVSVHVSAPYVIADRTMSCTPVSRADGKVASEIYAGMIRHMPPSFSWLFSLVL